MNTAIAEAKDPVLMARGDEGGGRGGAPGLSRRADAEAPLRRPQQPAGWADLRNAAPASRFETGRRRMTDFAELRERMVRAADRGARDLSIRRCSTPSAQVPREEFVDEEHRRFAYDDHPLPIEAGQTISQPYIVALMIDAAEIGPATGARGRRRLGLRGGGHQPDRRRGRRRSSGMPSLAADRPGADGRGSATTMSGSSRATARAAGPTRRRSTRSSPRRAEAMSRKPLVDQLAPGGRLVMPVGDPGWVAGAGQGDEATRRHDEPGESGRGALRPADR